MQRYASCCKAPWAPAVATLFSYGTAPQYVLPAHLLAKEPRLDRAAFGGAPVGDGPYRFVSWERGERLVYDANPDLLARRAGAAQLDIRVVPDPGTNFTSLLSGALDWNLDLARRSSRRCSAVPGIAFTYVPLALIAGRRAQHAAPAARRRARAARDRRLDRSSGDQRQDHVQALSGRRHRAAARSWARDPSVHLPAYDPAAADRLLDAAGWRRGPDGVRAKNGKRLALTYVQFPESQTGVRVGGVHRARTARARDRPDPQIGLNAKLFLPKAAGGVLATGGSIWPTCRGRWAPTPTTVFC